MKLTLERDALHAALGRIYKSVATRSTIPIVSNVLLRVEGDGITLVGSDLDMEASETVPARVARPGSTTVPAKILVEVVGRSASGSEVAIETPDDRSLALRISRSRVSLQTLPAADFPVLDAHERPSRFEIEGAHLSKLLATTQFAISTEETRYYLCGIYLHRAISADGSPVLRAVATDGHRLARSDVPAPDGIDGMPGIIIPRKAVAEIIRLSKDGGRVEVELSDRQIRVVFNNRTTLVSKVIEGTFPDYERVTPQTMTSQGVIDREALLDGLNRVAAVAGDRTIKVSLSEGRLEISTRNPDAGEAVEEFEVDYGGAPLEIGFDPKYVRDTLTTIDSDQIWAGFNSPGDPAVFEPKTREGLLLLIMPKRI